MIHPAFWMLPVVSAAMWAATLIALMVSWVLDGSPHYPSMADAQTIAYISDIGAQRLKPLFVAGSAVTVVTLDAAIIAERWLRHRGFLVKNTSTAEKRLAGFAIGFSVLGALGLILLSIFDTLHFSRAHNGLLLLFLGGYILTAIFTCLEYRRLGRAAMAHRVLRASYHIKLGFIITVFILALAFVILTFTRHQQQGAVVEWVIAFLFVAWVLSFVVDLLPASRRGEHSGKGPELSVVRGNGFDM